MKNEQDKDRMNNNNNKKQVLNNCNENNIHDDIKEKYKENNSYNKIKNNANLYESKRTNKEKYWILYILIYLFCNINSQVNVRKNNINIIIISYSYEITIKVKDIGIKNILSSSTSYSYPCPSKIYLNNELVQDIQDCHYINIIDIDSEIKMEWNNTTINSTKAMFYSCSEITEINMTKFDTSLVTDMSEMFSLCYSLKSLDVSNFVTSNVQTMENMFYKCTDLTSLNLESFTIPSITSVYRMFYDCKNLEYINIKNFEEKKDINFDEIFYNIAPNAVFCLSSCPPPTNFTITSMTSTQVTVSWVGYEWDDFIISYGYQGFSNPDDGTHINVNNGVSYTFTNLYSYTNYDVYIKTNCGSKTSYWIGPLSVYIQTYNLPYNGTNTIYTCSVVIYDHGGPNGNYENYANSILYIYPETSGKVFSITGSVDMETCCDYLNIYNGIGTGGELLGNYNGLNTIPLLVSTSGSLTIKFYTDYSVVSKGFELTVSCMYISKSIYDIINNNKCFSISCDNNWKNIQKIIDQNTTNNQYLYRRKCLNACPDNTTNIDFTCYSNSVLEKCQEYSIESESEDLCIKCNDNYYPTLDNKNNANNFINCYKNNSLEKYYLDNEDLVFKSCYKSCKTCVKNGTLSNHNCLTCEANYEYSLRIGEYFNCYPKCDNYYYFDEEYNFICLDKTECPEDYINLIEEKNECINECSRDPEYKFYFRKKCYKNCPSQLSYESTSKSYFCEIPCNKELPLELTEYQDCTDFCGINAMNNKSCISKYHDEDTNGNLILKNIKKDIITINFDKSILDNNKNIVINESFITFIITNIKIQKNTDNQNVNLGECENILKNEYNLQSTDDLIIFIINAKKNMNGEDKIVFEVYAQINGNSFLTQLDLNLCNNIIKNNEVSKCANYSIESFLEDLCISCCNSYFPKSDDILNRDSFIKCYKDPKGYYLDKEENNYKKCYLSCETCSHRGNYTYHNCDSCSADYSYELNTVNSLNCYNICPYYSYYDSNANKNYCTKDSVCPISHDKLIKEKNLCVEDCSKDPTYKYQFRHTCLKECPLDISEVSLEKEFYCEVKCPKEFPFEIIASQYCVDNCTISERQIGLCKINYESKDEEEDLEAQNKAIDNVKKELTSNFDTSGVDKGNNVIIEQKDSTITISTTDNQKNEKSMNITTINFGECEDRIKEKYDIPKNKSLYILKIDVKQKGLKIPKIEYEVYYPLFGESLIKLNLTVCQESKIDLSIPVELTENIDKMNSSSNYYNDICYTYTSKDGTDISLADRKKQFVNNNLTVCEEDCDFIDYDFGKGKAICSCKVKTNSTTKIGDIVIDTDKLYNSFTNLRNIANIYVLKCYRLIFILEAYKSNYANLILLAIIFFFIISFFIFICKEYKDLIQILNLIIFFRINPSLVKKFKERLKKELNDKFPKPKKKKKKRKVKEKDDDINIINNFDPKRESNKNEIPLYTKIGDKMVRRPSFFNISRIFQRFKRKKNYNHEPTKKKKAKKISFNNKNDDNNNIYNINNEKILKVNSKNHNNKNNDNEIHIPSKNDLPEIIFDKDNLVGNISDDKIYDMFIKINEYTPRELNQLPYKKAKKKDKRSFCIYYISLIKTKHLLFFSFMPAFDYNSRILKIFLFFFNFTVNFIVNALFFSDETMHKIYEDKGDFDFIYNLPQILYSALIAAFINSLMQVLALTSSSFTNLKEIVNNNNIKKNAQETKKFIKLKIFLFFSISIVLLVFFWFYLGCFCAVYRNTQLHLIKDSLISFGTSMIYPFVLYIFPGIFRIPSLKKKKREYLYQLSKAIQIVV